MLYDQACVLPIDPLLGFQVMGEASSRSPIFIKVGLNLMMRLSSLLKFLISGKLLGGVNYQRSIINLFQVP